MSRTTEETELRLRATDGAGRRDTEDEMEYTKTNWQTGDVITAEKLNNLEGGVDEALKNSGSGGGKTPLEVTVTTSESGEKKTVTFDKTASEVFAAVAAGKSVKATTVLSAGGTTITVTYAIPVEAFRCEVAGDTSYVFKCRCDIGSTDKLFYGRDFVADDPVVLTEV